MNLEPAPRLPKWIFLAIDVGLLLIAFLIISFAKDPYAPLPFVSAVLCAGLAAVIGLVPFLIDFAADSAEFVQRERERQAEQAARLNAAAESLARAAAQIKAIEEAVHKSARDAETLPYRMQEKLAEFNEALAAKEDSDREALETELEQLRTANGEQLKATAEKIAKAAADWTALEIATRKQLTATEAAITKLQTSVADTAAKADAASASAANAAAKLDTHLTAALRDLDARLDALKLAVASIPATVAVTAAAPAVTAAAEPAPVPSAPLAEPTAPATLATEPAADSPAPAAEPALELAPAAEPPKPKKPRAPRKPKAEDTLAAMSEPAADSPPAPDAAPAVAPVSDRRSAAADEVHAAGHTPTPPESAPPPEPTPEPEPAPAPIAPASDDSSSESAAEPAGASGVESSTSSDGATRLLATAYIGIGNKLFIRGDGPGLSWDHGVPMQFVSIGKWGWFTHDAAGPIRCKLYKNDETAALTGEIVLEAGRHTEVTALF
jgi:hypothetical protein